MKSLLNIIKKLLGERYIFLTLVKRDFESRYLSSIIGLPWAFIQPITYVLVVWFAFTYGLKVNTTSTGLAFFPWLILGLLPWIIISQTMIVSSMAINEYSFLIKKTTINLNLIPIVKIFSGLIIHLTLIGVVILLMVLLYGIYPSIYWIQFIYYLFALFVLLSGIAWLVSSINVFIKDMAHILNIIVTILFWATPIIWPYSMLHGNFKYIALFNPFFYITEGYRYTFLEKHWFFEFPEMNLFFWSFTLFIFILGAYTFQKLKPYFADVL